MVFCHRFKGRYNVGFGVQEVVWKGWLIYCQLHVIWLTKITEIFLCLGIMLQHERNHEEISCHFNVTPFRKGLQRILGAQVGHIHPSTRLRKKLKISCFLNLEMFQTCCGRYGLYSKLFESVHFKRSFFMFTQLMRFLWKSWFTNRMWNIALS